ncbi:HlyD family efflux transporter periplasmic adaptor subunit [Ramlibacter henchirensis]|uniref:HlyD family efflux transporter periplasmic adaptor subunit n=1 Tax=Ramlibacter henchirensis TaxID=204072 RepID=A0A4Z0BKI3_9BURK|nr:HlyD family efflux transporter periplasmic adaptor subunit [Ramlibacter henchirensis]TFY99281.1 HlyD family efflux transporter periplasmic adaptor subunit [Ramlibacter henchirensis]
MDLSSPPPQSAGPLATEPLLLGPLAAALSRAGLAESAAGFGAELCDLLGCARVAIGVLDDGVLRLAGSSHPAELQPGQPATAALLDAMQEALDQHQPVAWPPLEHHDLITLAHRQLAAAGAACSVPLVDGTRVVGAMTLERTSGRFAAVELPLLQDLSRLAAPVFELKRQLALPWHVRLVETVRERLAAPRQRRFAVGGAIAFVLIALAVPLPWRVSAPGRLEGSVQRAVVAASDGFLQQANVRPGDRVRAGQVLAELASQDLELERRRRESEVRQHEGALRAAQAGADRAQMVTFQAKAAEAQALLSLVEMQLQRARIEAPFDGIVIKGDLSQNLGAPVQRGDVLMVLAPNDSFRLILEVDEADIGSVKTGQTGRLALTAQPDRTLRFVTRRVVPIATTAEGRNYFEVEATLDEAVPELRPGLSGIGKVDVGWRPIAWLLAHRAVDWLRLAWWKVTPW